MIYLQQQSPGSPKILIAKFTRGERKGERYKLEYRLPETLNPREKVLLLTLISFETQHHYLGEAVINNEVVYTAEPQKNLTTSHNFFKSVTKNLKAKDWQILEHYFDQLAPDHEIQYDLIKDSDITFDFAETADGLTVPYAAMADHAGSVVSSSAQGFFILQDEYCANVDCDCLVAQIHVMHADTAEQAQNLEVTDIGHVRVTWEEGGKSEVITKKSDVISNKALLALADTPHHRRQFEARYAQIRAAKIAYLTTAGFGSEAAFRAQVAERNACKHQSNASIGASHLTVAAERSAPALMPQLKAAFPQASNQKVGRNEPCPCGSQKKFKKCCGA